MPASGGAATAYTPAAGDAWFPSWSPDGNQLAITLDNSTLAVMNAQPNAPAQVLAVHASLWVQWPTWSPDGTRLFYVVLDLFQPSQNSEMYVLPLSIGTPDLLRNDSRYFGLDLSPDGSQIVYSSRAAGTDDLWLMPSGGGTATRITSNPGRELHPAWSPDGTEIAYDDREDIWVIDSTGQNPTRVTFDPEYVPLRITWSPDGSALAFDQVYMPTQVENLWRLQVR
jgi:TolB protein